MRLKRSFSTGAALAAALLAASVNAQEESPESWPEGTGREETFYLCTACHGGALVTQQGLSREAWSVTIDFMVAHHGMPNPEGADRQLILDYLAQSFPPRQRGPALFAPFLDNPPAR